MRLTVLLNIFLGLTFIANAQVKKAACLAKTITVTLNNIAENYTIFYNRDKTVAAFTNDAKNDIVFEYVTLKNQRVIKNVNFYKNGYIDKMVIRSFNANGTLNQETIKEYITDSKTKQKHFETLNILTYVYKADKLDIIKQQEVNDNYKTVPFKLNPDNLYYTHKDLNLKAGVTYLIKPDSEHTNEVKISETNDANIFVESEYQAFGFLLLHGFMATKASILNLKYFLNNKKLISSFSFDGNKDYNYLLDYNYETNCNYKFIKNITLQKPEFKSENGVSSIIKNTFSLNINYDCTKNCAIYTNKAFYKPIAYNNNIVEPQTTTATANNNVAAKPAVLNDNFNLFLNGNVNTYNEISWGEKVSAPLCCNLVTATYNNNDNGKGAFVTCTDKYDASPNEILFPNGISVYKNWLPNGIERTYIGHNIYKNKILTNSLQVTYTSNNKRINPKIYIEKEEYYTIVNGNATGVKSFKYFYNKYDSEPDSCISYINNDSNVYSRIKYNRKKGNVISAFIYNSTTNQEIEYAIKVDKDKFNRFNRVYYFNYHLGIMDVENPNLLLTVFANCGDAITDITPVNNSQEQPIHFNYTYVKNNASYLTSMVGSNGIKNVFNYSCNYTKPLPNIPPPPPVKGSDPKGIVVVPVDTVLVPIKPADQPAETFDVPKTRQEVLSKIYGKWLVVDLLTEKRDCNKDGIYEQVIPSSQALCKNDDLIEYLSNGTWVKTQNTIKCMPNAPDKYDEGTWALSNDGKTFKAKIGIITIMNLTIEKLTDTEMVLTKTLTDVKDANNPNNTCTTKTVYSYKRP